MQVMVLAAGFGERLWPLTERLAKPAMPVFDEAVLGRIIRSLAADGADRIVYNTHHLAEQVAVVAEEACPPGVELLRSHEDVIQGTAGALRQAAGLFRDEPLVVLNGDVIHDVDLTRLVTVHRTRSALVTLVCRTDPEASAYGSLGIDGESRIRRFLGWRAPSFETARLKTVMFTGIQVIEPEILGSIPPGVSSTTEDLYPALLRGDEPVLGLVHEGYWMDIGTPARYLKVHRDLLRGKVGEAPKSGWRPPQTGRITIKEPVWVYEDAAVEPRSALGPYAVVGPGCRLGSGCLVERSVLMEGAAVGAKAVIESCIVAPGVAVPADGVYVDQMMTIDGEGSLTLTPIGPGGEVA